VTADVEHKVWFINQANDAIGFLKDFKATFLQIFRRYGSFDSFHDCLIDGDIVGKLVKAGLVPTAIHNFYFGVVDTIDFSFYPNATRTLAIPVPVVIGTVYYSKSHL
jgi:hypothetical protein